MSDKDLVFREEVLAKAYHHPIDGGLIISAYDIEHIHAVKLPMSAAEYVHTSNRMLKEDYRAWDRLMVFEENDDADKAIAWMEE